MDKGTFIVNNSTLLIDKQCTGIAMYALFFAFVFASSCKQKLKGFCIGFSLLFGLNILRLLFLGFVAYFGISELKFVHDFLWPFSYFVFTLLASYSFQKRCKK